jgi:hypothetical protein
MPDSAGNFKGQGWSRRRAEGWDRVFGRREIEPPKPQPCTDCGGTGVIPGGPYWDTYCPCVTNANRDADAREA